MSSPRSVREGASIAVSRDVFPGVIARYILMVNYVCQSRMIYDREVRRFFVAIVNVL